MAQLKGRSKRVCGVMKGWATRAYGTMRWTAMKVYGTMIVRATRVYGTMRGMAMRLFVIVRRYSIMEGHEGVCHHDGGGPWACMASLCEGGSCQGR